jgi:carboxyl-terminal processing protease
MGGIVMMVPGIAGYFVPEKNVHMGTLQTRETELKLVIFPRLVQFAGPVAVLTDACSVSAAELLSGGLQAIGRARVFGMPTAGEALPAQMMRLPNGDGFLFVFADYQTPGDQRLEGDGVLPDEPVPYDRQTLLAGDDPMLAAAARWIASQEPAATAPTTRPGS